MVISRKRVLSVLRKDASNVSGQMPQLTPGEVLLMQILAELKSINKKLDKIQ